MAIERYPLHSWKLGGNTWLKWPNRFTPDAFRVSATRRTVARAEFFGVAGGGQQIIEADGASAGSATAAAVAAALWLSAGNSAGSAATSGIAAVVLPTAGSSAGSAAASGVSGTLYAGAGSSAAAASASGIGAALITSVGASSGVATASAISATIAAMLGSSDGIAVSEAIAATVLAAVGESISTNTAHGVGEGIEEVFKTGTGGIDPEELRRRPLPVKPTGILHLPPKRGKQTPAIEERIEETARDKAEIARRLASEFTEETALLERRLIKTMSIAQIDAEIGFLLRNKLRTQEDEILMLLLIAAAA